MTVVGHINWPDLLYVRLSWGRDGARTIGDLAEDMQAPRREIEKAIEELRRSGAPICTGSDGVWLTSRAAELEQQVDALRRRAITQLVNVRALRRTAKAYRALAAGGSGAMGSGSRSGGAR